MDSRVLLAIVLLPLMASAIAGLFGRLIGRAGAHWVTCTAVGVAFLLSCSILKQLYFDGVPVFNASVYTWLVSDGIRMEVGFLVDKLSAMMMVVVTFVSFCVHVYTIGYMKEDPGYQRFFSYISLFTFSMLMLVMSNNFLQLFFGWEAVGVVSYLLIGFWYTRPSAIFANMKAFLVNRIGDFGFILGIAAVVYYTGSLDYAEVFAQAPVVDGKTIEVFSGVPWSVMTLICICLFIGAMGKSAQVPLHVWLPDSMEGPTPISALIHAATMVTAGIFMLARMSPLFELSETALTFVITIGATTAFFTGLMGLVNNDIKRVVAYSTLSQLGYMIVACGASAYSIGMFHLMTHAFFKALLFLAAGSVIIAMHHEQDMRKMGGLRKYMPITYITCLLGALALIGTPGFSGFFSKDALIEAVHASNIPGATYAYYCVLLGVFVTALYTFRMIFMTFHGPERFHHAAADAHGHHDDHGHHDHEPTQDAVHGAASQPGHPRPVVRGDAPVAHESHPAHPHETPWVVWLPLVLLAIPSVVIGWIAIEPMLFGGFFEGAIFTSESHDVVGELAHHWHGAAAFIVHAFQGPAIYLAIAGVVTAWLFFLRNPHWADAVESRLSWLKSLLVNKYYFDWFNEKVIAPLARGLGLTLWKAGDQVLIDGALVNGSAKMVGWVAGVVRHVQSGYLYHYAFAMIIGLSALLAWFLLRA